VRVARPARLGARTARLGRSVTLALLAWTCAASPAGAHPSDIIQSRPATFAGVVQRIRAELGSLQQAREAGDLADQALHATALAGIAGAVPGFAMTVPAALRDSAAGRILKAAMELGVGANALRRAAETRDTVGVAREVARLGELYAVLDTYAPKQYVCPMHCEVGKIYESAGRCPVCGMYLQRITDDRYRVEVTPVSGPMRARVPVTLHFQIKDPAGFDVDSLQVVHEKRLHLMMVSHDLAWFSHEHPVPGPHGSFTLRTRFPAGGRYVLYHDFTPDSIGMQVVPVDLVVEGDPRPTVPLVVDDTETRKVDGYEVRLAHGPLLPNAECAMTFTLARGGRPVSDLEPFLGAMGHLVMISEDRAAYVHSHPLEKDATTGPAVTFRTIFSRTGTYKAWGQFQRHGRVLTVPFVVEVTNDGKPTGAASVAP
jgi:heavy metal-binding protein